MIFIIMKFILWSKHSYEIHSVDEGYVNALLVSIIRLSSISAILFLHSGCVVISSVVVIRFFLHVTERNILCTAVF